jgi:transcriptional regulator with XRE-family HTH domain
MVLSEQRRIANLTQNALAERVGITRQMISAIENGAKPSVDTAKKIAAVIGVDWHLFFQENGSMSTKGASQEKIFTS